MIAMRGLGLADLGAASGTGDCMAAAMSDSVTRLVKSGLSQLAAASNSSITPLWAGLLMRAGLLVMSLQSWLGTRWIEILVKAGTHDSPTVAGLCIGSTLNRVEVKDMEPGTLPMPCTQ